MIYNNSKILKYKNASITVGLLGGSFNPAHAGHFHISHLSKKKLNLKAIWWLVAKQNPLKSPQIMLPFHRRVNSTLKFITPYLKITDLEQKLNLTYTIDIIKRMKIIFPNIKFVWIMGADNLIQLHRWHKWQQIFYQLPILVFDRGASSYVALNSKAAIAFKKYRVSPAELKNIALAPLPAWGILKLKKHPLSSTYIRQTQHDFEY